MVITCMYGVTLGDIMGNSVTREYCGVKDDVVMEKKILKWLDYT